MHSMTNLPCTNSILHNQHTVQIRILLYHCRSCCYYGHVHLHCSYARNPLLACLAASPQAQSLHTRPGDIGHGNFWHRQLRGRQSQHCRAQGGWGLVCEGWRIRLCLAFMIRLIFFCFFFLFPLPLSIISWFFIVDT